MPESGPETDWRVFRELREVALDRFCRRVLEEATRICSDTSRGPHERYLEIYRLLQARDESLGRAFDDPRRSRMLWQLAAIALARGEGAACLPGACQRESGLSSARAKSRI